MRDPRADRNLLLGVLALQMDFITRDALIAAMHAWVIDKDKPLGDILVGQGAIDPDDLAALEVMVGRHVARHGGDPERSLAALSSVSGVAEALRSIADPDVEASLRAIPSARVGPHEATVSYSPPPSSSGGRYRKLRDHASGGLGVVYVAHDTELNREVALKEIRTTYADDPSSRTRFVVEAEVTGGLEHPGIVPVYGLGKYDDGRPFYAMRFIKGDSLKDAIGQFHAKETPARDPGERTLSLQKLLRRFLDVCNAIDYAHSRGILHRDLKPGNVMVGKYGETLVVDWGLAKSVSRSPGDGQLPEPTLRPSSSSGSAGTLPGSVMGTPGYMSPEQAAGRLDLMGPPSDVYSLGATLYALLTGKAPFKGDDPGMVLCRVQHGDFERPRQVIDWLDPALEAVCLKAMALEPEGRYGSPRALANDIERWIADEPVSAYPEGLGRRLARWGRRNRSWVRAGTAALILVTTISTAAAFAINVARRNERTALGKTREALASERSAKAEAEANFRTARKAVDDYLTGVSENTLLKRQDRADLRALRKELLEGALKYYKEFITTHRNDEKLQEELGFAYTRFGTITAEIGSKEEALHSWKSALAIRQQLADNNPRIIEFQDDLGTCHNNIGFLQSDTGHPINAIRSYERSLAIYQKLADDNPSVSEYRTALAGSYHNIGNRQSKMGQPVEALRSYQRALAIRQKLVDDNPSVNYLQNRLAQSHNSIGSLHSERAGRSRPCGRTSSRWRSARSWPMTTRLYPNSKRHWPTFSPKPASCRV